MNFILLAAAFMVFFAAGFSPVASLIAAIVVTYLFSEDEEKPG